MPLAHGPGGVPVVAEHLGEEAGVLVDAPVEPGEAGGVVGDAAHAGGVMVAPGEQAGPRGRAHRRGVEAAIAQPSISQTIEVRRVDVGTEASDLGETDIVEHHEHDVGRAGFGTHDVGIGLHGIGELAPDDSGVDLSWRIRLHRTAPHMKDDSASRPRAGKAPNAIGCMLPNPTPSPVTSVTRTAVSRI